MVYCSNMSVATLAMINSWRLSGATINISGSRDYVDRSFDILGFSLLIEFLAALVFTWYSMVRWRLTECKVLDNVHPEAIGGSNHCQKRYEKPFPN